MSVGRGTTVCSRRVCGRRPRRSRSFAFSGLEGGTCRLPALPTRHPLLRLLDRPLGQPLGQSLGRPLGQPPSRRLLRGRLCRPLHCRPLRCRPLRCRPLRCRSLRRRLLRPLPQPLRRPPSAGSGSSRFPATGRPMTARCTGARARRGARYLSPVRALARTQAHRKAPSRPVLLSRSARANPPKGPRTPRSRGPGSSPR
jgi:hypothetical protein